MLETLPAMGRYVLRGDAAALGLPDKPLRATRQGERVALWQGPDEWLILQPAAALAPIVSMGAVVEVSDRQIGLLLSGPEAEDRLNAACPLDLAEVAFPIDMTARTMFGKAEITLWRVASDRFHIEVARSFAEYVAAILELRI